MPAQPLVSVIVPCFNAQNYIIETLQSILAQTLRDIEVIVVDDGSSDTSGALVKELQHQDERLRYIYQKNLGLPGARNTGLDHARGQYISFVDNDDLVHPRFLEILLHNLRTNDADISICEFENFPDGEPMHFPEILNETQIFTQDQVYGLINTNVRFVVMWNKLYRKEIFANLRFPLGKWHEDESLVHYITSKAEKTVKTAAVLYGYRNVAGSMARKKLKEDRFQDVMDSLADREQFYKTNKLPHGPTIARARWNFVYWNAVRRYRASFAMKYLLRHPLDFFRYADLPTAQKPREYLRILKTELLGQAD